MSNDPLKIIRVLLGVLELADAAGLDTRRFVEAQRQAKAEGRDLTDEELEQFRNDAQSSIDAARNA